MASSSKLLCPPSFSSLRMTGIVNLQLINDINMLQILEPVCSESLPTPKDVGTARRYLIDLSESLLSSAPNSPAHWCRVSLFLLSTNRCVQHSSHNNEPHNQHVRRWLWEDCIQFFFLCRLNFFRNKHASNWFPSFRVIITCSPMFGQTTEVSKMLLASVGYV